MKRIFCLLLALSSTAQANSNIIGPQLQVALETETECLAMNIYHEARSERTAGMWAVADVTINRVKSIQFPNTVCEVVKQGPVYESWKTKRFPNLPDSERIYNPKRGQCQFSWYCDGRPDVPTEMDSWARSLSVARSVLMYDLGLGLTDGADHYHTSSIDPYWNDNMIHITTIGNHKFFKSNR